MNPDETKMPDETTGSDENSLRRHGPPREPGSTGADTSNRGVLGLLFVVLLVVLAIWLMNRMQTYAALGDCAFTHAPQCRELLDK